MCAQSNFGLSLQLLRLSSDTENMQEQRTIHEYLGYIIISLFIQTVPRLELKLFRFTGQEDLRNTYSQATTFKTNTFYINRGGKNFIWRLLKFTCSLRNNVTESKMRGV
jgi:hypothetical protein